MGVVEQAEDVSAATHAFGSRPARAERERQEDAKVLKEVDVSVGVLSANPRNSLPRSIAHTGCQSRFLGGHGSSRTPSPMGALRVGQTWAH